MDPPPPPPPPPLSEAATLLRELNAWKLKEVHWDITPLLPEYANCIAVARIGEVPNYKEAEIELARYLRLGGDRGLAMRELIDAFVARECKKQKHDAKECTEFAKLFATFTNIGRTLALELDDARKTSLRASLGRLWANDYKRFRDHRRELHHKASGRAGPLLWSQDAIGRRDAGDGSWPSLAIIGILRARGIDLRCTLEDFKALSRAEGGEVTGFALAETDRAQATMLADFSFLKPATADYLLSDILRLMRAL